MRHRGSASPAISARCPAPAWRSSDDLAAGVLAAAHRRGIAVPERLSVTGFDDAPLAQAVWPALTTVRQPVRAMADAAADLLLDPAPQSERRLAHEIVVRESTAPPAA